MTQNDVILLRPRPYATLAGTFVLLPLLPQPKPLKPLPSELWTEILAFAFCDENESTTLWSWSFLTVCKSFSVSNRPPSLIVCSQYLHRKLPYPYSIPLSGSCNYQALLNSIRGCIPPTRNGIQSAASHILAQVAGCRDWTFLNWYSKGRQEHCTWTHCSRRYSL